MNTAGRPLLLLATCVLLAAACSAAPPPPPEPEAEPRPQGMPAMQAADIDALEGAVAERLEAGHYTYVRVGGDWAVVLGQLDAEPGDTIALRVQGSQTDFHSRKLGRDFERLYFATRKDPT